MAFEKPRIVAFGLVLTAAAILAVSVTIGQTRTERTNELDEAWTSLALGAAAADNSEAAFDSLRSVVFPSVIGV